MTDGIEAVRALNLPGCPTAHFLTDPSEALAVPPWEAGAAVLGAYLGASTAGAQGRHDGLRPPTPPPTVTSRDGHGG